MDVAPPLGKVRRQSEISAYADLLVDHISDSGSGDQPNHDGKGHSTGRRGKGDTGNEDDGFQAFSQHGDEWEKEHGIFLTPSLEGPLPADGGHSLLLQALRKLDPPFLLHLGDAEKGSPEDSNDDGGNDCEGALPIVLGACPFISPQAIEGPDQAAADDQTD